MKSKAYKFGVLLAILGVAVVLAACTPAYNWRTVQLSRLQTVLPCKPDQAQREVQIGAHKLLLQVKGCQAQDTLYAITHATLSDAHSAREVIADWRQVTLANIRSTAQDEQIFEVKAVPKTSDAIQLRATGLNPQAGPIQAQLVWFASGRDVFHIAVYGPELSPQLLEPLFTELRIHSTN